MNPCNKNNEVFRGAGVEYTDLSEVDKVTAFRRAKDTCNKSDDVRDEMMVYMTLGGMHPNIMKGLGE